ncbi:amidohydrolase family protein [Granulosicoccus sp. 3-233]|uniref:amidohydrolase family protein n=1 Tax=Granulosicoccus sp. 3-233 TaxID=3417969 RepID=UPI003D33E2C6
MIDAHVHIWDLSRGETLIALQQFPQLTGCEFLPADMEQMLQDTGATSAVLVHGPATQAHTEFCLSLARRHESILSVIGWVDARGSDPVAALRSYRDNPDFRGIRLTPMLDDDPQDYLCSDGVRALAIESGRLGLVLEVLAPPELLWAVSDLCEQAPDTDVVIAHFGLPEIDGDFDFWSDAMQQLAQCANTRVKVSGLPVRGGNPQDRIIMAAHVDALLEHFGTARLLYASNWPVMTAITSPATWQEDLQILLQSLSDAQRRAIFHENALRLYGPTD